MPTQPRSRRRSLALALCATLAGLAVPSQAFAGPNDAPLAYRVDITKPATRYVEVQIDVPKLKGKYADFAMPAWAPGSYLVRDFGRHVYEVSATSGTNELAVERRDKQTWRVQHGGKPFVLRYRVFADELSVRTSYVDDRMALLNGTSVFMYLVGDTERPAELQLGARPAGWRAHTSLEGSASRFRAADYDALVDAPLLLGEAQRATFEVAGASFEYVLVAPSGTNADLARLSGDAQKVVAAFADIMGGLPFSHYSFLMVADAAGGGGLEHTHSTAMILPPFMFTDDEAYVRAARLAAHEFFHAWNVKRIHDRVLGPFDYSRENYSSLLWFHEGFTETMEARAVLAAGILDDAGYLASLAKSWGRYAARPGSDHTPISQLSRDAWIKAYKPSSNHRNTAISYYLKGDLIGVLLDLEIRKRAQRNGRTGSLEGLFRRLWTADDAKRDEHPITHRDVIDAASAEAGEDMSDFFARYVDGNERLPLPEALRSVGFEVFGLRPGQTPPPPPGEAPAGSDTPAPAAEPKAKLWLGAYGGSAIMAVDTDSPAERAGLAVGDEPIAIDGTRIDSLDDIDARLVGRDIGDRVRIDFFRRGRLDRRFVTLAEDPSRNWVIRRAPDTEVDAATRQLRAGWLPPQEQSASADAPGKKAE